jgi:hypothetical protein
MNDDFEIQEWHISNQTRSIFFALSPNSVAVEIDLTKKITNKFVLFYYNVRDSRYLRFETNMNEEEKYVCLFLCFVCSLFIYYLFLFTIYYLLVFEINIHATQADSSKPFLIDFFFCLFGCIYLSISLFIYLSIYLFTYLYLFIYFVYLFLMPFF